MYVAGSGFVRKFWDLDEIYAKIKCVDCIQLVKNEMKETIWDMNIFQTSKPFIW